MRFDSDFLDQILSEQETWNKDELKESANYAQLSIDLKNSAVTCAKHEISNFYSNSITKPFPEHVIGCKEIGEEIYAVTSRNTLTIHKNKKILKTIQCDYYATSICSLILGTNFENLRIFFGSVLGDLIEWHPAKGKEVLRRKGHKGMIFAIANDSKRIFTISDDRTIRMWNQENSGNEIFTAFGHMARPFAISVDERTKTIYTGGIEQTLFIWNYGDEKKIELRRKIFLSIGVVRKITQIDENTLAVGSHEGNLLLVDVAEKQESTKIEENIMDFGFLEDCLAVLYENNTLIVYSNEEMDEILCQAENVRHMSASEHSIVVWNEKIVYFLKNRQISRLQLTSNVINASSFLNFLLVKTVDGFLRIYEICDAENINFLKRFKLPKQSMIPSAFVVTEKKDVLIVGTTHGDLFRIWLDETDNVDMVIDRRQSKSIFGDKEVTCIELINGTNCFMTLAKIGNWTVFEIDAKNTEVLNNRTFSTNHRMTWPCRFFKALNGNEYIVGFHGTNLVIWDCSKTMPICEFYCGGGHRNWQIRENFGYLEFDFVRNGTLFRQKLELEGNKFLARSAHVAPIVSAAGTENGLLATVSLDGNLVICSGIRVETNDYKTEFTMFAGENLLCTDIYENENLVYVIIGGGKSKISLLKIEKKYLGSNVFKLSHHVEKDEGRVVAVKIFENPARKLMEIVVSYSSGLIIFLDENLNRRSEIQLDDMIGIGAKVASGKNGVFVGTSGSFALYLEEGKIIKQVNLNDRSGVTAIASANNGKCVVGCDSGAVFLLDLEEFGQRQIHSHLSTVVGIVTAEGQIHSTSLDCAIVSTKNYLPTISRPTVINMPGAMTSILKNVIVVAGDGIQSFLV